MGNSDEAQENANIVVKKGSPGSPPRVNFGSRVHEWSTVDIFKSLGNR